MERADDSGCLDLETLSALSIGAVDGEDLRRVETHLAECSACAGMVADAAWGSDAAAGPHGSVAALAVSRLPAPSPEPDTLWADKYRVERLLGRGGMGIVFSAWHLELGRRVAIKVLHRTDPQAALRLIREAQITARVGGANVPRIFDLGRLASGAPYIVMEYLTGEDLAQVASRGPVPPWQAVRYILQVCGILGPVHAAGVVHRDLKPANIFLEALPDGSHLLKVLDFGISKSIGDVVLDGGPIEAEDSLTSTGMMVGSPRYMSPEQLRASPDIDRRTDVWSLGVILYELVSGQAPFQGPILPALAVSIATDHPSRPSSFRPEIEPGLDLVILRCLEKERAVRFQSVEELARALTPFAHPGESRARLRGSRRYPVIAGAALAVLIGLLGTIAVMSRSGAEGGAVLQRGLGVGVDRASRGEPRGPNLVANPGFERGDTTGWTTWGPRIAATRAASHGGAYAGLISHRTATWQGPVISLSSVLAPGASYAASVWVRINGASSDAVALTSKIGCGTDAPVYQQLALATSTSTSWVQLHGMVTVPICELSEIDLYVEGPRPGIDLLVDDVVVQRLPRHPAATNVISNADFEEGGAGWAAFGGAFSVSTAFAHAGKQSGEGSERTMAWSGPSYVLPPSAAVYEVSAWALQHGRGGLTLLLSAKLSRGSVADDYRTVATAAASPDIWVRLHGTLAVPEGCTSVVLYLEQEQGPEFPNLYIDDVSVVRIQSPRVPG